MAGSCDDAPVCRHTQYGSTALGLQAAATQQHSSSWVMHHPIWGADEVRTHARLMPKLPTTAAGGLGIQDFQVLFILAPVRCVYLPVGAAAAAAPALEVQVLNGSSAVSPAAAGPAVAHLVTQLQQQERLQWGTACCMGHTLLAAPVAAAAPGWGDDAARLQAFCSCQCCANTEARSQASCCVSHRQRWRRCSVAGCRGRALASGTCCCKLTQH